MRHRIFVMRHAERPADAADSGLSPAGAARAAALASYFPAAFGKPHTIFAAASSTHSRRPLLTVAPLAAACDLEVDTSFGDADTEALAEALCRETGIPEPIVVCWRHGGLPSLLQRLGAPAGSYPDPWDAAVFNLMLALRYGIASAPAVTTVIEPF